MSDDVSRPVPWSEPVAALAARMAAAVTDFLTGLAVDERRAAAFPFASAARIDWHYVPRRRPGLPLRAMSSAAQRATWRLLEATLSEAGLARLRGVLALEAILQERAQDKAYRDPANYALAVFGVPGPSPWAWRFEGHHASLTLTVVPGVGVAVTPQFFGANPFSGRVVPDGHGALAGVLDRHSDLAFEILSELGPSARREVVIAEESPADIVTGPGRERSLREPVGLPLDRLPEPARQRATRLLETFFGHLDATLARAQVEALATAGLGQIRLAWAGALSPGGLHYYRFHGPSLILEYDRTDADHAHAVWHDPENLFGEDHLRRHHRAAHGG